MSIVRVALGVLGGALLFNAFWWVLLVLLFALAGCSATGEMPVCESNCSMTKSWGVS